MDVQYFIIAICNRELYCNALYNVRLVQRHICTFYASTVCHALHVCLYDVNYSLHQRQKTVGNL